MPVELRLLCCALALAEHKNFARAARAVHVSQPTLSRSIQDIEMRVGTKLFERGIGGVAPTDAGKIFLEQARDLVARSGDLDREMNLLKGLEKGELNIGAGTYPSSMLVGRAIARLARAHPAVRLQIHSDNRERLFPMLRKRELDLAVIILDDIEDDPELRITRLNQYQPYFVARGGHPLQKSKRAPILQSVLQFPVVMASRPPSAMLKSFLIDAFGDNPVPRSLKSFPAIACESVAMMKMIVAETDAITLLPLSVVSEEVRTGKLVVLSLAPPAAMRVDFGVVRLAHRSLSPIGETFVRLLQETDEELSKFEQKNAPKFIAPPRRTRSKPRSATSVG